MKQIICRKREIEDLDHVFKSKNSEFVAVYGRRRIGKTYLIHHYCMSSKCVYFHVTGIRNGTYEEQLEAFIDALAETFYNGIKLELPKSWFKALELLNNAITTVRKNKKIALFFDEFPWLLTRRSRLLQALEYQWNRNWALNGQVKLIICGSSSSWILKNIINNTGGLYNRVTCRIKLNPFNLSETKSFFESKNINLSNKRITEFYMVMGGIPFYLSKIQKNYSVSQMIDKIFFNKRSTLHDEYKLLLSSLFEAPEEYDTLLREIANHRYGITQAELLKRKNIPYGGRSVKRLSDLEDVGFIQSFIPKGRKEKGKYFKVIDEYILFYLCWIEPSLQNASHSKQLWSNRSTSASWRSWSGYAFEAICYKHIDQIAHKLQIDTGAQAYSWQFVPVKNDESEGAQIDLLFDRNDDAVTICEIKYTEKPFTIDKQYAEILRKKKRVFRKKTRTDKQIFIAMITSCGVKKNSHYDKLISATVLLDDLFQLSIP